MLGQRRRRWSIIKPTLGRCIVFCWVVVVSLPNRARVYCGLKWDQTKKPLFVRHVTCCFGYLLATLLLLIAAYLSDLSPDKYKNDMMILNVPYISPWLHLTQHCGNVESTSLSLLQRLCRTTKCPMIMCAGMTIKTQAYHIVYKDNEKITQ